MSKFNNIEFGENIRKARKAKGLSQENLANALNVSMSTIARYESGFVIPTADQISMICDELGIHEYELFNTEGQIQNKANSKNPFGTNMLYICYNAYFPSIDTYKPQKFKLIIKEKPDRCLVDFLDYKTNKVYLTGYVLADKSCSFMIFENYEPNNPRLEVSELILDISNGLDGFINGSFTSTNGHYTPSIRRCIASLEDFDIDEDTEVLLSASLKEIQTLQDRHILYLDTRKKKDFEK